MNRLHRLALVGLLLGFTVGCDQATKYIATANLQTSPGRSFLWDVFRLTYAENRGAFLSLGASLPDSARFWILTVVVGLLLLGILVYALFGAELDRAQVTGYAFIAGGGISNWVDRALRDGMVVDFMNMGIGPLRTGVFNVADLAIMGGIGVLLVSGWLRDRSSRNRPAPAS